MNNKLKWKLTAKIADRVASDIPELSARHDRVSLIMDLDSVDSLNYQKLLDASPFDFSHDIWGIVRHMDRSSYPGKLKDCFVPRCSSK